MKRFIAFLLLFVMLFMAACNKNNNSGESSDINGSSDLVIIIADKEIKVDSVNKPGENYNTVLYDKKYTVQDELSFYTGQPDTERVVLTVKCEQKSGKYIYEIVSCNQTDDDKADSIIPVNGFVLSIKKDILNGISVSAGQNIVINNYDQQQLERTDLTTVSAGESLTSRRIYMKNPEDMNLEQGKIYYTTPQYTFEVPENSVALELNTPSGSRHTITGKIEQGGEVKDKYALVFCGEYNLKYSAEFYKEGSSIRLTKADLLNTKTDVPSVVINDTLYKFDNSFEVTDESERILYTNSYDKAVTPDNNEFIDIVIVDKIVSYISPKNTRTLIPSEGYILTFRGESTKVAEELKLGDILDEYLIIYDKLSSGYLKSGESVIDITGFNTSRTSGGAVLYSDSTYASTGTDNTGIELIILNDKITGINKEGNSKIPEGGYVLSIASDNKDIRKANNLNIGEDGVISLSGDSYGYKKYEFTAMNTTRLADYLVIYNDKFGKKTDTNIYGYEIIVDAEGNMSGDSYSGDQVIPEGGFVLSAHGDKVIILEEIYTLGAKVEYDENTKRFTVLKTPDLPILTAAYRMNELNSVFDNAKNNFYSIDYKNLENKLSTIEGNLNNAKQMFNNGEANKSIIDSIDIKSQLDILKYELYESKAVENRAVWYRSYEKTDAEVRSTVESMIALNINAVYIETWYNGYVIGYIDNPDIQHKKDTHGDFDVLEAFCRIGHEYGLEIHIWVENFFIGTENSYLYNKMKDYLCIDRAGKNNFPNEYGNFIFLNPYNEYCRDLVLGVYRELIEKYEIDGIHLDYIRFSEPQRDTGNDFGYNEDIIKGFQEEYNTDINPKNIDSTHSMWKNWCKFRENIINSFVKEVYDLVQETKPDLWISSACYPAFNEVPLINYQNFLNWVENGWMDEIFSMSYGSDIEYPVNNANDFENVIKDDCFYSAGLNAFSFIKTENLVGQTAGAREVGADGVNLFSWGSFIDARLDYYDAFKAGIFSKKAVQSYKLSLTVKAGLERLIEDIDNVYKYLAPGTDDFYNGLEASARDILKKADGFDPDSADKASKITYITETLADLNDVLTYISDSSAEQNLKNAVSRNINVLVHSLNQSFSRISG